MTDVIEGGCRCGQLRYQLQLEQLARKFERLERKLASHDQAIVDISGAIRLLMHPAAAKRRSIADAIRAAGVEGGLSANQSKDFSNQ